MSRDCCDCVHKEKPVSIPPCKGCTVTFYDKKEIDWGGSHFEAYPIPLEELR